MAMRAAAAGPADDPTDPPRTATRDPRAVRASRIRLG
jgi:hypothetical protein